MDTWAGVMATIRLIIEDIPTRAVLKGMLEAEGHAVGESQPDVLIASEPADAVGAECPALVAVTAARVPEAVRAMRQGVFGYILLPFQPGEAAIMVRRALEWAGRSVPEESLASLDEAERLHVLRVLRACKFNQARTAKALGIGRNTLWRKLKTFRAAEPGA